MGLREAGRVNGWHCRRGKRGGRTEGATELCGSAHNVSARRGRVGETGGDEGTGEVGIEMEE